MGLEACGASHHWARWLWGVGHEGVLLPPQYVKAYVKRGKNDAIDAAAICEAMSRPSMRFVPIKSAESQAALMLLRVRDLMIKQRTMLINAIRGHAAEFGVTAAKGPVRVTELLQQAHSEKAGVPPLAPKPPGLPSGEQMAGGGAEKARCGGAGQKDGRRAVGHDGQQRDLPASAGGLTLAHRDELTWHLQGEPQDGDRSNRGSGHPGESSDAQTSRICSGPGPRNPSWPAVEPTAHTGPTHERNRPDPFALPNLANRAPSTHGFRVRRCAAPRNDHLGTPKSGCPQLMPPARSLGLRRPRGSGAFRGSRYRP